MKFAVLVLISVCGKLSVKIVTVLLLNMFCFMWLIRLVICTECSWSFMQE